MHYITDSYLELNRELHRTVPSYGMSGSRYAAKVLMLAKEHKTQDILDYGCGKSTLANELPFKINQFDPAILKFSLPTCPADLVICTDVLEHVEPDMLRGVLTHLKSLVKKAGFFSIALLPAKKTLADGRNAHLIVEPITWWEEKLKEFFIINTAEVIANNEGAHQLLLVTVLPNE